MARRCTSWAACARWCDDLFSKGNGDFPAKRRSSLRESWRFWHAPPANRCACRHEHGCVTWFLVYGIPVIRRCARNMPRAQGNPFSHEGCIVVKLPPNLGKWASVFVAPASLTLRRRSFIRHRRPAQKPVSMASFYQKPQWPNSSNLGVGGESLRNFRSGTPFFGASVACTRIVPTDISRAPARGYRRFAEAFTKETASSPPVIYNA